MPRYFFHIHDNGVPDLDDEGTHMNSVDHAHSEAVITAGDILKIKDGNFRTGKWNMRVVDETGGIVSDITVIVERTESP